MSSDPGFAAAPTVPSPSVPAARRMDAIVLAAGQGTRAGLGYPKQLARLGGRPILIHVLDLLQDMPEIHRIVVAVIPERCVEFAQLLADYQIGRALCVPGGATRQESVRLALEWVQTPRVVVHEAVRPFVTTAHIRDLLAVRAPAVVPVLRAVSTVLIGPPSLERRYPDRRSVRQVQLPQVFDTALLRQAHNNPGADAAHEYTDDSSLVWERTGDWPALVPGLEENIKITTPLDLVIAEAIYHARSGSDRS